MWVRSQDKENILVIDNVYSHNGFVISTYDGESPIELGRYESKEETFYILEMIWGALEGEVSTFEMPAYGMLNRTKFKFKIEN